MIILCRRDILTVILKFMCILCVQVKLLLKEKAKQRALQSCHEHPTSGHQGVTKTWLRLTERYYWKGMSTDVRRKVGVCIKYSTMHYTVHVMSCSG